MKTPFIGLTAGLALAACGPVRGNGVHPGAPVNESAVRLYDHQMPTCPFREVGSVAGEYRQMQTQAFRMHANAVLLEPAPATQFARSGTAIIFTRPDCQE